MKTREEVEQLKRDWVADPKWKIEQTLGFSEYYVELFNFRTKQEAKWECAQAYNEQVTLQTLADQVSVLYNKITELEKALDELK